MTNTSLGDVKQDMAARQVSVIVAALYAFFDKHPEVFVYATGSTKTRTRLYQIGITRFYEEMVQDFELYGQIGYEFYAFEVGKEYVGFLTQWKFA